MRTINMTVLECSQLKGQIETNIKHAIYIIKRNGTPEYIGSTMRPVSERLREHLRRIGKFINYDVEIRQYDPSDTNIVQLRRIETDLINEHKPIYNFKKKLTRAKWPMFDKHGNRR